MAPPRPLMPRPLLWGDDQGHPNKAEFEPKDQEFPPRFSGPDQEEQARPQRMEPMQPPFQERMPMRPGFPVSFDKMLNII